MCVSVSLQTAIPGIRNFVFGFLGITEKHILALDISFGTIGYSLILARAFQEVNMHNHTTWFPACLL